MLRSRLVADHVWLVKAARCRSGLAMALLLLCGCRGIWSAPATHLPDKHAVHKDQLLVKSDLKLPDDHPLLKDLAELREEVIATLDLPQQEQRVVVYLFRDEERYARYLQAVFPQLPVRRAYFVGTPNELAVYAFWGEKLQEDLRHEYTHGLLHASLKDVPLWLDEGIAEYFEVAASPAGWNPEYATGIGRAIAGGWKPDLARLEAMESVAQMQRDDYQEAWCWVHFLLHHDGATRTLLLDHLRELKEGLPSKELSAKLRREWPTIDQRFMTYAAGLMTPGLHETVQR